MTSTIKLLQNGDEGVLMNVAADVFDKPIDLRWTRDLLADPRHHLAVAIDDGRVVGFASAVDYLNPDKPPELWINEVSVSITHQRLGLGKALLNALFEVGRALDCHIAWVCTNRSNTCAMALYSSAGGVEGKDGLGHGIVGYSFKLRPVA